MSYDLRRIRNNFPILHQQVHGADLVYLDNAASTQKPRDVIQAEHDFYLNDYANVHRAVHELSHRATQAYESAREKIRTFLNAPAVEEIIFVRGTTEGINLVAASLGVDMLQAGDEILLTEMEHHSNIVPWQFLAERQGLKIRVLPMLESGVLDLDRLEELLTPRTKLFACTHMSNALGTVNAVRDLTGRMRERGILTLIDGAQSVPHMPVDVQDLGCDFFVFSGHKAYGPSGIGVLWGRRKRLEQMPPYQGGGDMILTVTFDKTVLNDLPYRFEAGTPNIAGAIGLGAAVDYLHELGMPAIQKHEQDLLEYGTAILEAIPGLRIYGTAPGKGSIFSFGLEGIHPHDVGTILDQMGIAVRTGHHCSQPVMDHFGIPATTRASLGIYNGRDDIDRLAEGILKVQEMMG